MILYFYDLVFKTKKDFNRKKRRFYYYLNKLNLPKNYWLNKSVLLIPDKDEYIVDQFFKEYKKSEREIKIYKIFTSSIEEI